MIKNRTKITIQGLNQEKILNEISKSSKVFNFKRQNNNISSFEVEYKNSKKIKKILEGCNIKILSFSHFGIKTRILTLFKSYGILFGLCFCLLAYALQYNFVLQVRVFGAEKGLNGEIISFVNEILPSRIKGEIATLAIENQIREKFDEVSSVSVAIVGQVLVVNVNEIVLPDEMNGSFQPIVSQYDGRIVKINLIQGTLAVNEGDIIKKGDILVYPYILDSQGQKIETQAKADIQAEVWLVGQQVHYDCLVTTVRTGKTMKYNQVYLNNLLVYSNEKSIKFADYEIEKKKVPLSKNLIFPFFLTKITIYERQNIEIKQPFSEVKEKIVENARQKALIFLQENEIIKEENITLREGNGWHQVSCVLTVMRNVGG